MIDSPGFDDAYRTDAEVLSDISTYLSRTDSQGFKLSGIIYLHPISQVKIDGSSLRSLRKLRKLVGDYALGNVVLATSHWSRVSSEEGIRRETELKNTFWKDLISRGAIMTRYSGDQRSGNALIDLLIDKLQIAPDIQRELVDEGKKLIGTTAGHILNEEMIKLRKEHEEQLKKFEGKMDAVMRNRDKNAQEE
ncbi:hypothetical protein DL95DRAFT_478527 [Leptodontidium sp. 2 PMI_412]|nr:hypothetical protein DL95DRAFT_478527 [Leptodontidium sp. 2 PMI_412]